MRRISEMMTKAELTSDNMAPHQSTVIEAYWRQVIAQPRMKPLQMNEKRQVLIIGKHRISMSNGLVSDGFKSLKFFTRNDIFHVVGIGFDKG